jgi:hypothetical protein
MGHLLDRVVIKALADQLESSSQEETTSTDSSNSFSGDWGQEQHGGGADGDVMPLPFWLTVLSLALNGPVPDRIRILYEIAQLEKGRPMEVSSGDEEDTQVTLDEVRKMVGHLQNTCQLVPDKQVVPTETKYPAQQYKRGTPIELVQWEGKDDKEGIDIDAFAGILRSKSVCAWGECYHKKKFVP